ncbi:MAG TPA: hypothetical protein VK956_06985, partial [Verrucomicrobium sp.]|nr:hypothetical protein [Verrucomicrobium sp.]
MTVPWGCNTSNAIVVTISADSRRIRRNRVPSAAPSLPTSLGFPSANKSYDVVGVTNRIIPIVMLDVKVMLSAFGIVGLFRSP